MVKKRSPNISILLGYEGETEQNLSHIWIIPILREYKKINITEKIVGTAVKGLGYLSNFKNIYDYIIFFTDEDKFGTHALKQANNFPELTCIIAKPINIEGHFLHCLKGFSEKVIRGKTKKKNNANRNSKELFRKVFECDSHLINKENFPLSDEQIRTCPILKEFWNIIEKLNKQ